MSSSEPDAPQPTHPPIAAPGISPLQCRLWALLALAGGLTVLGIAVWLQPDARGYGTHQQLGFGKCGMLITTGLPCPTCGMTTAFAHTVRGQWLAAIRAQPTGFVLALATAFTVLASGWVLVTGRLPRVRLPWMAPFRVFLYVLILLIGGWAAKIVIGLLDGTLPDHG